MIETITTINRTPILSLNKTKEFVEEIDLACIEADFDKLKVILAKYNLTNHLESKDFLIQGERMLKNFNNHEKRISVMGVSKRKSRCIACSFGKTVNVYDISYKKQHLFYSVSYTGSFALNFEIENGFLMDFGWCNAYLSKKEMKELNGI